MTKRIDSHHGGPRRRRGARRARGFGADHVSRSRTRTVVGVWDNTRRHPRLERRVPPVRRVLPDFKVERRRQGAFSVSRSCGPGCTSRPTVQDREHAGRRPERRTLKRCDGTSSTRARWCTSRKPTASTPTTRRPVSGSGSTMRRFVRMTSRRTMKLNATIVHTGTATGTSQERRGRERDGRSRQGGGGEGGGGQGGGGPSGGGRRRRTGRRRTRRPGGCGSGGGEGGGDAAAAQQAMAASLPKTASQAPMAGALGVLCLGLGAALTLRRKQR